MNMNYFKEQANHKTIAVVVGTTLGLAASYYAYTSMFSSEPAEEVETKPRNKSRKSVNKE
jgi:hypothetical protein